MVMKKFFNRKIFSIFVVLFAACILGTSKYLSRKLISNSKNLNKFLDENKTNATECKNRTIYEFPDDFLTLKQKKDGGILIHILLTLYLFAAIAIVCDDFFVQSLNRISSDLKLKDDFCGATFMAAGSSAPELFTSIIGVIVAKSDVGTGTIVGSAVFNVLFIIAVCALAAKKVMHIDWYPLTRDCFCYIIAVGTLLGVLNDGYINWYEATILLVLYIIYIALMCFNGKIEIWIKKKVDTKDDSEKISILYKPDNLDNPIVRQRTPTERNFDEEGNCDDDDDDDDIPLNPFKIPQNCLSKITWIILFPINLLFFLTVPDCRRKTFRKFPFYFLTFLISTLYLGVLTYVLVWMVVIISFVCDIPDTVAGLTILAAGTSIPEVVSGIIVTRKGKGDMAISNSLGSNVFDILICLGLPWFISTVIINTDSTVKIYSEGIFWSTLILLSTIIMLILCFKLNKWQLDKKLGFILIFLWIIVTTITCLFELDVFGKFSLPLC